VPATAGVQVGDTSGTGGPESVGGAEGVVVVVESVPVGVSVGSLDVTGAVGVGVAFTHGAADVAGADFGVLLGW
jgi:hypothetical protein